MMRPLAILLAAAVLLLAGCADSMTSDYHKHPRALMREVVTCENNGGALAGTPECRRALAINSRLF